MRIDSNDSLSQIHVADTDALPELDWSRSSTFWVPNVWLEAARQRGEVNSSGGIRLTAESRTTLTAGTAEELRLRNAFIIRRPLSSRLPVPYHWIPMRMRATIAALLGHGKRRKLETCDFFPSWPLDLSVDFLMDLSGAATRRLAPTPVILSHDIDSAEGLVNLLAHFLPLEEACGAQSVNFVVPCKWELDHGALQAIQDRGHEIGVHGYDHSNRTAFCSAEQRKARLDKGRRFADRYKASGYRAPSLVRTENLLRDLAESYHYDSSIPTSGGIFPTPQNGCATARLFSVGNISEIPLTMPRDGSLRFLGYGPKEILQLWIGCAQSIQRSGGIVMLLTHCERTFSGNEEMLMIYRRFIEYIREDSSFAWSSPEKLLSSANG